jgi:trimethyllysine dioxygenase
MPFQMYEEGVQYQTLEYILKFDLSTGKLIQFRYNNNDRAPFYVSPEKEDQHYSAINDLLRLLNSPENTLKFKLHPHQLLVTNNWRVLHGRSQFDGYREMVGAYINMEEFLKCHRSLFPISYNNTF